ncbi:MAG: hypothetical protein ACRC92_27110 [Peptostreptococcaceae bacterium]
MKDTIDLRSSMNISAIVKCYLAEDCKRITSSEFRVYIPSLMGSIPNDGEMSKIETDDSRCLNEEGSYKAVSMETNNYVIGKAITPYFHRLDGWIPEYKTERTTTENETSEDGSIGEIASASSDGVTERTDHDHPIIKAFKMITNKIKSVVLNKKESNTMVHFNSTEVDFQELHRMYIKRGHQMYGAFIDGDQFEFVILAIDGATPYLTETEERTDNKDNPTNLMHYPNGGGSRENSL